MMTPFAFLLTMAGIGYVSAQLTRFFVWLDGTDDLEEDAEATAAETPAGQARPAA